MSQKQSSKNAFGSTGLRTLKSVTSLNKYDFIDLGGGDGASLVNYEKIIGGRGLGVDLDKKKVKKAQDQGLEVVYGNALDLHKQPGKVDFVTCDNFLEHLLSFDDVEKMMAQATKVARKFVYIRHPSFEDIDYLAGLKLKTYWSDWHGHTSMLKVADIVDMLRRQGVETFRIVPVSRIKDSTDPRIIPLSAPVDQHDYMPEHGPKPKPKIIFNREVYFAFDIIGMMPGAEEHLPELLYDNRMLLAHRPRFVHPKKQVHDKQPKPSKTATAKSWAKSKARSAKHRAKKLRARIS